MPTCNLIHANRYQDSVTLMQAAERLRSRAGIADAALMMGTDPNKELLQEAGLLTAEGQAAGPNDLIVAVTGGDADLADLEAIVEALLRTPVVTGGATVQEAPHSLAAGLAAQPDTNLVLISTPGLYAAAEARKALMQGRHVMIFSDNVSIDDEAALKALAGERGLLLMGPDCGTAIVGGVPLGFANAVRRGNIGVVGASGTGMQEITTLIDRYGGGISHALGTGSHDLSARIGGAMTLAGLKALLADPATSVVVVVSKPPAPEIAARVLDAASGATKPVVFAFLGMDRRDLHPNRGNSKLALVDTLEDAARQAVAFAGIALPEPAPPAAAVVQAARAARGAQGRYIRGLFSGGTFCYEAMLQLRARLGEPIQSNIPLDPAWALADLAHSSSHTCIDMGADSFTVGRPHPMIDLAPRVARLLAEAADPTVAVLLLDVVLGYGAHPDPAAVLAPAIQAARQAAGRDLPVVVHLCGTPADPQGRDTQAQALAAAGAILAPSNAAAAHLAAAIVAS